MNCNTTHYRANSSSVPGDPTSKVILQDLRSERERELTIVYPEDADLNEMKISILSPSAIALLGCKVGDRVEWPAPNGVANYVIKQIKFQPESVGRFDL